MNTGIIQIRTIKIQHEKHELCKKMWKQKWSIHDHSVYCSHVHCNSGVGHKNIRTSVGWRICPKDTGLAESMLNLMLNI